MRIKIDAYNDSQISIPFNYQCEVRNAILKILFNSFQSHPELVSEMGIKPGCEYKFCGNLLNQPRFSFSKLNFYPYTSTKNGFVDIRRIQFVFTAPVFSFQRHYIYNLFINKTLKIVFPDKICCFEIKSINILPERKMTEEEQFFCLSPIAVRPGKPSLNIQPHYFDYSNTLEKGKFQEGVFKNLVKKYELLYQKPFIGNTDFEFDFERYDILKHKGKISKLVRCENQFNIKTFEARFHIKGDPELVQLGYDWGFGYDNYNGLGCVEQVGDVNKDDSAD